MTSLVKTKLRGNSKSWTDASWGAFRRQLEYKLEWQGNRLVPVSQWYPSSKLCSTPGRTFKNDDLSMDDRFWTCPTCCVRHDRDINAAINILSEGLNLLACGNQDNSNVCGETIRLLMEKQVSLKQNTFGRETRSPRL